MDTITTATGAIVPTVVISPPPIPPTWATMCRVEPRLVRLAHEAQRARPADWQRWEAIRRQLSALVGWNAAQPALRGSEAFEIASFELAKLFGGSCPNPMTKGFTRQWMPAN